MFTHVTLSVHVIWDDVQYSVVAIWQEDPDQKPVTLTKSGRTALGPDDSPDAVLLAAVRALQGQDMQAR